MKRRIVYVTGSRAEYGLMRSTLKAIQSNPSLDLKLIATGMHLEKKFGNTINNIARDKLNVAQTIKLPLGGDSRKDTVRCIGNLITKLADSFTQLKPDIVLLEADRFEILAAAVAAVYMNIPIAHVSGGDKSGETDDMARHAITKLASIHFPGTRASARRIQKMGEEKSRIFMVGTPGIEISEERVLSRKDFSDRFGISIDTPFLLMVLHPIISEQSPREQMRMMVDAAAEFPHNKILIYPNADAGGREMIQSLKSASANTRIFPNLPREAYLCLLKNASALVGNSSSGIVESPFFGTPVVNIGTRQQGRERAANVIDCSYTGIKAAIAKALSPAFRKRVGHNPYESSISAAKSISRILGEIPLENLTKKKMTY